MQIKLLEVPFCRDVDISVSKLHRLESMLDLCSNCSGFLLTAPEHRLSLELKVKELSLGERVGEADQLQHLLDGYRWMDILDESDELLHHRFQLVYACGAVQGLPGGSHRWCAAEALLGLVHGHPVVAQWMDEHSDFLERAAACHHEAFRQTRVSSRSSVSTLVPEFHRLLAEAVLSDPPHELDWMKDNVLKTDIVQALINEDKLPASVRELDESELNDVLALRGFLAGGILVHCLQKRHRVDFGVARPGKKKLSVPFRGADTPSHR